MTIGSLFAGIGGLELGLESAGFGPVLWQVEKDAYCRQVLARRWPNAKRYEDIKTIGENLEPVDLICGGFPCQPVSTAGKRKGTIDDRWLWPDFARIVRCLICRRNRSTTQTRTPVYRGRYGSRNRAVDSSQAEQQSGTTESRVGGMSDGISIRLDQHRWPAGPGSQHEWEPPRQTRPGARHRVARMKALGNAVVPQCSFIVGKWIMEALQHEFR